MLRTQLLYETRIALQQAIEEVDRQIAQSVKEVVIVENRRFQYTTRKGHTVTVRIGKPKGKSK